MRACVCVHARACPFVCLFACSFVCLLMHMCARACACARVIPFNGANANRAASSMRHPRLLSLPNPSTCTHIHTHKHMCVRAADRRCLVPGGPLHAHCVCKLPHLHPREPPGGEQLPACPVGEWRHITRSSLSVPPWVFSGFPAARASKEWPTSQRL